MKKQEILKRIDAIEPEIISMRRDLHQIPELQLLLPKTVAYVCARLDEMGIPYKKLVNGNAVVAEIQGTGAKNSAAKGDCIAIRADMDGLPVLERTGLPFASKHEGQMHACGHDGHMAMALGAAKLLMEMRDQFHGTVKFLFQPAEESPGGALPMIEEGAMENPHVDAVIGLHHGSLFGHMKQGKIGACYGTFFAAADRFSILVKGKGSHGALPHNSVDPIPLAAEIVTALQRIVSREVPPLATALITLGQIHAGTTHNVIPNEAFIQGTVRTTNEEVRQFVARRIEEIAKGIAQAHRGDCEVNYEFLYPILDNDPDFTQFFVDTVTSVMGDDIVEKLVEPTLGGEDMAYFLQKAPGTFFVLHNPAPRKDGSIAPHHTEEFDLDESTFRIGSTAFVATALAYFGHTIEG